MNVASRRLVVFLIATSTCTLLGCQSFDAASPSASGAVLGPTSFKYGYGGEFGPFEIADTAAAYNGGILVGRAQAVTFQESPTGGAKILKIRVTHLSVSGDVIYTGFVYIQAGFGGGTLVREEDVSGRKQFTMFGGWPFGH